METLIQILLWAQIRYPGAARKDFTHRQPTKSPLSSHFLDEACVRWNPSSVGVCPPTCSASISLCLTAHWAGSILLLCSETTGKRQYIRLLTMKNAECFGTKSDHRVQTKSTVTSSHTSYTVTNKPFTCSYMYLTTKLLQYKPLYDKVHLKLVLTLWQSMSYFQRWLQFAGELTLNGWYAPNSMLYKRCLNVSTV